MPKLANKNKEGRKVLTKSESDNLIESIKVDKRKLPHLLRGFKDILPDDEKYWNLIFNTVRDVAHSYGFSRLMTPILEESRLFERTAGETSDIVSKELFRFNLSGEEKEKENESNDSDVNRIVALRPEGTAPAIRAYLEHGMVSQPQPVKLWYFEPMFRYDRPQFGRYRQFYQWGFEVIGESSPIVDAQVIIMTYNIYKTLGLDVVIPINSIGDAECRPAYLENLKGYLRQRSKQLCEDCQGRIKNNPLRVFDCKEESCQEILSEAPQMIDWLCEDCRNHFVEVLELLDEIEVPYFLDSRLVRGLDYYTRTAFEFFLKEEREDAKSLALSGGGRYDGLAEVLGGRPTPAVGVAPGVERTIIAMKQLEVAAPHIHQVDIFIASLGREARRAALRLYENLRGAGYKVAEHFAKDGLSNQLEKANRMSADYTLILGQKEMLDGTILIRDMLSGIQEEVNFEKIIKELDKRLSQSKPNKLSGEGNFVEERTEDVQVNQNKLFNKKVEFIEEIQSTEDIVVEDVDKGEDLDSDLSFQESNDRREVGSH